MVRKPLTTRRRTPSRAAARCITVRALAASFSQGSPSAQQSRLILGANAPEHAAVQTKLLKYPRTQHVQGSKLQPGDEDLSQVPMEALRGAHLVIEEKLDGANSAVSFTAEGELRLQSRGHFLTGGPRERHFALLKTWAAVHRGALHERLGARYVMYGEWLYAKHTVFYDRLPHYFLEFDLYDRETGHFLATPERHALLADSPVRSVPVVHEGPGQTVEHLRTLIRPSLYKSAGWRAALDAQARATDQEVERVRRQTDVEDLAEGLYLKREAEGRVLGRYKFIRPSFLQSVQDSGDHWHSRPILPNQLAPDVDILQ